MLEEKSLYVQEEMSALDERFVNAVCLFCECSFFNMFSSNWSLLSLDVSHFATQPSTGLPLETME